MATSGEALPRKWVDAHIHLDLYEEQERLPLLNRAFHQDRIAAVVAVSMHLGSSRVNRELARRFAGRILPAYGFHPEQELPAGEELDQLFGWIKERFHAGEPFAIGEVGLPYYSRKAAEEAGERFDEAPYLALLERFAVLAAELDRPIVLHAVYEDADKACGLLERHGVKHAHFHWFKGSPATVQRMIARGYSISITPDVCYEEEIQELVRAYPLELMMTETDGPWPFEGHFAGQVTQPGMVAEVAAAIAKLKGISLEAAETQLLANAIRIYRLDEIALMG
ncbi:TatD family hydrolase [Paenibacillus montanisoli]|uniref:TatD family deoxyribonuclease n=1 Tax=Paenibacillus montanisoli TaxID=2081970 RepID=A0A328U0M2_9BACL|nr:TatD family hydrolase [Paenibacillus montanisoli]RAP76338.1 TatD family deoxyribonuclease [Paenibacillus montanisoli]